MRLILLSKAWFRQSNALERSVSRASNTSRKYTLIIVHLDNYDISWVFLDNFRSEYWDVIFSFNCPISVSISLKLTSLKLKASFLLHIVPIARMLGCFLYLRMGFTILPTHPKPSHTHPLPPTPSTLTHTYPHPIPPTHTDP